MDDRDDAHPVAIGSGRLLGMALGLVIMAGQSAWQEAMTDLCMLGAVETGQSDMIECPSLMTSATLVL